MSNDEFTTDFMCPTCGTLFYVHNTSLAAVEREVQRIVDDHPCGGYIVIYVKHPDGTESRFGYWMT